LTEHQKRSRKLLGRGVIIALVGLALALGVVFLLYDYAVRSVQASARASQTAEAQSTSLALATTLAAPPTPTETLPPATITLSPVPIPIFSDFIFCRVPCSGFNDVNSLPEKTSVIYAQWRYRNVPAGAAYERTWSLGIDLWVKYSCLWDGPSEGIERISMVEDRGFHSGTWTMTIKIEGTVVMQEAVFIQGNWDYWDPAGEFDFCPAPDG
jgi:hypothetical protein